MEDELVLFTSYFNLVDGRRQDSADTFRVDTNLQSPSSPDGTAALYIVTEASTGGHVGPRARRLAADTIAWEYASHTDEQPATRLRGALQTAHNEVLREFQGHVAVGATVMAVERDTVYLAQVAPAQVYVLHEGSLNSIPASASGTSPFSRALGGRGNPQLSVFRDQVAPGDVLAICSTWFDRAAETDDLRECFAAGTADEIAECMLDLAQQHDIRDATGIVIEAALSGELEVAPTGDAEPGLMEQIDLAVQALASVGRMVREELRPAREAVAEPAGVPARASAETSEVPLVTPEMLARPRRSNTVEMPAVETEPDDDLADLAEETEPRPPRRTGWRSRLQGAMQSRSASTSTPEVDEADGFDSPPNGDLGEEDLAPEPDVARHRYAPPPRPSPREEMTEEIPVVRVTKEERQAPPPAARESGSGASPLGADRRVPPTPQSELEQVNSRLHEAPDMSEVIPPVQSFEDASSTEPARIYPTSKDIEAVNRRPRRFGGAGSVPVIRPGLSDVDLRKPVVRQTPPAFIWATIAVVLVLAVGALAFFFYNHARHQADPYPRYVLTDLRDAKKATKPADQTYYLNRAKHNLALARQSGASAATVASLGRQIQGTSDTIYRITRVGTPVLITNFSRYPGSRPASIAAAPGVIYIADPGRKGAFSDSPKPNASPTEIAADGDQYSGFTVGIPQYVATDGGTALVLDSNNVLVRDVAGSKTATSLTSQSQNPGHYVSMAVSDPDVYLLDTSNSQVWRYPGAVSGYTPAQAAYWDTNPPKLNNGVSIAFDRADLYILRKDGSVLKYDFQALPVKFSLNLKTPLQNPVALYTDANQKWVWIADPANGRILQVGKDGTYDRTYVSTHAIDLSKVKSIAVGPAGNTIYVLTGSKLYDFPVQP
jgi:hypothetical protein